MHGRVRFRGLFLSTPKVDNFKLERRQLKCFACKVVNFTRERDAADAQPGTRAVEMSFQQPSACAEQPLADTGTRHAQSEHNFTADDLRGQISVRNLSESGN